MTSQHQYCTHTDAVNTIIRLANWKPLKRPTLHSSVRDQYGIRVATVQEVFDIAMLLGWIQPELFDNCKVVGNHIPLTNIQEIDAVACSNAIKYVKFISESVPAEQAVAMYHSGISIPTALNMSKSIDSELLNALIRGDNA